MKKYIITLIILLQNISFYAQKIQVLDRENSQPVPFANIYFPDLKTGTTSNENGIFLTLNPQKSVLTQISYIGYKTFLEYINTQHDTTIFLTPDFHDLQEIVVSTSATQLQGENIANVTQFSLKNSENQGINLTEKLKNVTGLDNYSTGAGIGKPVIRGLSGNRIAVFSQGLRVENQQWGDEHGLGLDENGYESVEVIKGAVSLLYGSDALGGVLYFADERFAKENSVEASLNAEYQSNTFGLRNNAAFKISKNRFHFNTFGGYTTHKDYADGEGFRVPNSRFNTGDLKTTFGYTGEKFVSSLKYNFLRENYGLLELEEIDENHSDARISELPYQQLVTHLISSENTVFLDNNSKLKIDLGYVFNNRKEFENEHAENEPFEHQHDEAALNMNLSTFSYNAKWHSPDWNRWNLIVGSQGMLQNNSNHGDETLIPDAKTLDFGLFAVTNFHYAQKAYWQVGGRFDTRNINANDYELRKTYNSFNFSTGIFQPIDENLSLRLNLSSGFRSPNMFELLADGVHEGTNRYERGNIELKTENAYQADFSLNYNSRHLEIFANPYFNLVKNFIYLQPSNEMIDDMQVFDYVQNNAILYGGEAGFHFHPHPLDWLHLQNSYSATFGEKLNGGFLPLMPSQKINTTLRANFRLKKILKNFSVFVQHQYSFAQNRIAIYETQTPDYHLVNCGISVDFQFGKQTVLLNIAANNLLNEVYFDHLSRYKSDGIYNIGRNVVCKISLPLRWNI